jgi:hypothetical protein
MTRREIAALKAAVEHLHSCLALFYQAETVREVFRGELAWEHEVATFNLTGHPSATVCFAWHEATQPKARAYAVLAEGPVKTARDAVRASIAAETRYPNQQ